MPKSAVMLGVTRAATTNNGPIRSLRRTLRKWQVQSDNILQSSGNWAFPGFVWQSIRCRLAMRKLQFAAYVLQCEYDSGGPSGVA